MRIDLPEDVRYIIKRLNNSGHSAYAVGGCVRDCILGQEPADWDITTSASPEEVKSVFGHTIDTGIEHGTVTVRVKGSSYEVTTFRVDGEYLDGRHPEGVTFVKSLDEDLKRRDFTINAMAYSEETGLVDLFGGREDLDRGIIRCVGDPMERFSEDALRMMRAVRFAAKLGFSIDEDTAKAIRALAPTLEKVSAERIREEFLKLIMSDHPEMMRDLSELGLTRVFFPEWDEMLVCPQNSIHHYLSVGEHTIRVMEGVSGERVLRLAALFHDVAKPQCRTTDEEGFDHFKGHPHVGAKMARRILRSLKFDNDTTDRVCHLVEYHDLRPALTEKSIRRAVSKIGYDMLPELFELKRADTLGQSDYMREEKLHETDEFERLAAEIREKQQCVSIKELAVTGRDLKEVGIPQGPEMGRILHTLLDRVLEDPELNNRDALMKIVSTLRSMMIILLMLLPIWSFAACGKADDAATSVRRPDMPTRSEREEETGEASGAAEEAGESDNVLSGLYILEDVSTKDETMIVQDIITGQEYRYAYNLVTLFYGKYGQHIPVTDLQPGMVVELGDLLESGALSSVSRSDRVWDFEELRDFDFDADRSVMKIFGDNYKLESYVPIFSGSMRIEADDITESDELRVFGIDKDVISVAVTTGHGYLAITNTELFDDSLLQVGKAVATLISGDMTIEIPEGKYKVTVANNGYGGTKKVKIKRGRTTTLDLNELKGEGPKTCELSFKVNAEGAKIYLDGKVVKPNKKQTVVYGRHSLKVEAEGYDTWERILFVNSPSAEISLDPEETSSKGSTSADGNSNSSGSSSESSNSGTSNTSGNSNSSGNSTTDSSGSSTTQDERDDATLDYLTTLSDSLINLVGT